MHNYTREELYEMWDRLRKNLYFFRVLSFEEFMSRFNSDMVFFDLCVHFGIFIMCDNRCDHKERNKDETMQ